MKILRSEWLRIRQSALARNAVWMMAGQGAGIVLQAVYFVILARLLGVVQYGIFAGAFAFTIIVAQYSTLGNRHRAAPLCFNRPHRRLPSTGATSSS